MRYAPKNAQAKQMGEQLVTSTLDMIAKDGFYEYYDPTRGQARPGREDNATKFGFATFSWPAAIFIKLYEQYRNNPTATRT